MITAYDQQVTVTLSADQWDTIRIALLCAATDSREQGHLEFAAQVSACYHAIAEVIPPSPYR